MMKLPMMNLSAANSVKSAIKSGRTIVGAAILALAAVSAFAQSPLVSPQARITSTIDNASRSTLSGSLMPQALPANDAGAVPPSTKLQGITLVFSRTQAQQAALDALVAAQQNPASPQYHQWLTSAQFGAQFGVADSDIASVQSWLQQQGFAVESVSRSRDRIRFTGTAAQVASAFGASLHYFKSGGQTHFAPASALSVPSAIAGSVAAITNLTDFRPRSHVKLHAPVLAKPNFTSSQSGSYYTDPKDLETIYNVTPAYNAGYTGAGQTIVIIGQSFVYTSDITNFQSALGITPKAPTLILMPGTGTPAISEGDELESDLDLEYSSSIATGATVDFVYTGNNPNYGAFDSLEYAVDEQLGLIISSSYGDCETDLTQLDYAQLNGVLQQAAAQGQTVISAAGDDGSTDCFRDTNLTTAQQEALAVDFPASSQYVTGLGGSEFPTADVTAPNTTYWTSASGSDVISSAIQYIPEQVWNDDSSSNGLSSGGGGVSAFTPRPTWQTGVTGITSGSFRLVPDISLDSSPNNASLLYCSSDPSTNITGSCSNGFRDANDEYLTVAGGTSFAAPTFSGMLAIINQAKGYTTGQGVVNTTFYSLASNATTYASAFHDITSGSNECLAGINYCNTSGASEYPATTGYDEASGLGSLNLYSLLTAWPTSTTISGTTATTTTITAATTTPASGASDTITITVASASSSVTAVPVGSVSLTVNGTATGSLPLTNGVATYTFSSTTTGSNVISATYTGSTTYSSSTGSIDLNVGGTSFTLAIPNITVTDGSSVTDTITVTPVNGYTGTIDFSLSGGGAFGTSDADCYTGTDTATVTSAAAVTSTLTFYTSESVCNRLVVTGSGGKLVIKLPKGVSLNHVPASPRSPWKSAPASIAFAGLLIAGCFRRRSRILRGALALSALVLMSFSSLGLTGCSSGSSATNSNVDAPTGTYTITLTGVDSGNPAISYSTNFTITVN